MPDDIFTVAMHSWQGHAADPWRRVIVNAGHVVRVEHRPTDATTHFAGSTFELPEALAVDLVHEGHARYDGVPSARSHR